MLSALTLSASGSGVLDESLVSLFQRTHNALPEARRSREFATLVDDGKLGPNTRRQLIADYMHRDGTTLPDGVELTAHGCGENYPLDASGARLDSDAADAQEDVLDRRVELFFFDGELGIQPPVPGKNSKADSPEYPEWRRRARETRELEVTARGPLDFSTFAPSDVQPELIITDARGDAVANNREQGVQEGDILRFSMLPEVLPAQVEFTVLRDTRVDRQTGLFDAVALRDALFIGDLDKAQNELAGASNVGSSASRAKTQALVGGEAAAPATQQKLRFLVRWANPRHRFLRNRQPNVKPKDGSLAGQNLPLASGSTPGRTGFDVPDDTTSFDLTLEIKSARATLVDLRQTYEVLRPSGSRPSVLPKSSNTSGFQHPRIHSAAYTAGPPGTTVIEIQVDLLFLDVTAHVLALPVKSPLAREERNGRFERVQNRKTALDIKSEIRILEFTGGRPTTWPVIIPPGTPAQIQHSVLLFLKNEAQSSVNPQGVVVTGKHTNPDNTNYEQALVPWWASPKNPGRYVDSEDDGKYELFPSFGWDKKLRDSKKTPIVLFPVPHDTDMGVLDPPNTKSRALLASALLCLFVDGQVKTGSSSPPFVRHLAVGAWSSGTDTLFKWVPVSAGKSSTLVDEFWIFDGKKGFPANVEAWFRANPKRRLRLIGTAYTEVASNQVKVNLGNHPNVFVHPGDPKYWYQSADYKRALSAVNPPGSVPLRFRKRPGDPQLPNDATTRSNIIAPSETLVDKGIHVVQSLVLEAPGNGRSPRIGPISNEEAATLVVLNHIDRFRLQPISTAAEFQAALRAATVGTQGEPHATFRHRHPWSVFGGLFNHKGRAFVGYFQLCLEESGL